MVVGYDFKGLEGRMYLDTPRLTVSQAREDGNKGAEMTHEPEFGEDNKACGLGSVFPHGSVLCGRVLADRECEARHV